MTYPGVGDNGPSVGAGGRDESDAVGPMIVGAGDGPATLQAYPPAAATTDASYPPGPSAAGIVVPRAVFHDDQGAYVVHGEMTADSSNPPPVADRDHDAELPDIPRYEGPQVPDQPALVNPSAGTQGPAEQGMTDVNPQGRTFAPGDLPPAENRVVYPDTTQDVYPR
jgi:hypothetical protein